MPSDAIIGLLSRLFRARRPGIEPGPSARILLLKTHALGDVLMTTPAVRALRNRFPNATLEYWTGHWSEPVLRHNSDLDAVITFADQALQNRKPAAVLRLVHRIRTAGYDAAVLFHPSPLIHLLTAAGGVRLRIGLVEGESASLHRVIPWQPFGDRYVGDFFFSLVQTLGVSGAREEMQFEPGADARHRAREYLAERLGRPFIVICPGGGSNPRDTVPAKRWPAASFAALAERLVRDRTATILLLGGPSDREILKAVAASAPSAACLFDIDILQLGAFIQAADLLITNDSAPLHLGIALKVPTVAIFGPTNPANLLPPEIHSVFPVVSPYACSPCYSNQPFPGCIHDQPVCMTAIPVEEVFATARKALQSC